LPQARDEMRRHDDRAISVMTQSFLDGFRVIDLDRQVAERAVTLRRKHRIKLPDAIVWASAEVHSMLFITRDERDVRSDDPAIRIPYRV
jgi:predicted nucleic acid-binding protein